jgi:hypothetical protein
MPFAWASWEKSRVSSMVIISLNIIIMPKKMDEYTVYANIQKANAERREYAITHADVLEQIYQHLYPEGRPIKQTFITCPCGKKGVGVWKIKQHICSKQHRKVFPTPELSQFVSDHPKPAIDINSTI